MPLEPPCFISTFQVIKEVQPSYHSPWELSIRRNTWPCCVWQKLVIKHHKVFLSPVPDSHRLIISSAVWHVCILKSELFIGQPRVAGNQPGLENFNFTSQPCLTLTLFTSVSNPHPILITGQGAWKDLSVCLFPFLFGFHGLASWLHRKQEKLNRKKGEMCFTSVLFRENPSCSRQYVSHRSHKGVETSVRRVCTRYAVSIL